MLLYVYYNTKEATWKTVTMLWGNQKEYWGKQLNNLDSIIGLEDLGSVFALPQPFTKVLSVFGSFHILSFQIQSFSDLSRCTQIFPDPKNFFLPLSYIVQCLHFRHVCQCKIQNIVREIIERVMNVRKRSKIASTLSILLH